MKALIVLAVLGAGAAHAAAATEYEVRTVDFPSAANTALYAVNDAAICVGAEKDAAGLHHAFVLADGHARLLDLGASAVRPVQSWAFSINNRGDVAGAMIDAGGTFHGYVHHRDGSVEVIGYPGGADSQAYGINDRGSLIGTYNDANGNPHAFVRRDGQYSTIDLPGGVMTIALSINDREEIAGEFITAAGGNGFGYIQKRDGSFLLATAPGSDPNQTYFISINNRDQVLGAYANAAVAQQNFLATGSSYASFDLPAGFAASYVSAQTVNDADEIVGYYLDGAGVAHGFFAAPDRKAGP
jgi:probable HAF family extracellular repeat protein